MNSQILEKSEQLVLLLRSKNMTISTAESCTGGMLSSYITAIPGASAVIEMGITSYSNRIKNSFLNVKSETLQNFGAVSQQTAAEMANNIRNISGADIGISVTGVAGPDGQDGYDAGVVFVGISTKESTLVNKLEIEPIDRNYVREKAVFLLLDAIIKALR